MWRGVEGFVNKPNRTCVDRLCLRCGKGFKAPLKEVRIGKGKCCSLSCAAALASLHRNQKGSANNNWQGGLGTPERKIRYKKKHPERHAAHRALTKAIRSGLLIRIPCELCGKEQVEGHHEDYAKPLVVRWLCKQHHLEAHGNRFRGA